MIGATLITPAYAEIGLEAVKRFKRHTGIDVVILWRDDGPDAFAAKLDIPLTIRDQTVVFFDSDWWMIRDCDLSEFQNRHEFFAVPDLGIHDPSAFCSPDSKTLNIDQSFYFNSGFWIANFRYPSQGLAFAKARQLYQDHRNGVIKGIYDFGEQSVLNAGIQRAECDISFLESNYNFIHWFYKNGVQKMIPWGVFAIHAAGIPKHEKIAHLKSLESVLLVSKNSLI
jgi:lipopolysaccharide biosynthesis glycosyltransferase